jgi:hypothetical protein
MDLVSSIKHQIDHEVTQFVFDDEVRTNDKEILSLMKNEDISYQLRFVFLASINRDIIRDVILQFSESSFSWSIIQNEIYFFRRKMISETNMPMNAFRLEKLNGLTSLRIYFTLLMSILHHHDECPDDFIYYYRNIIDADKNIFESLIFNIFESMDEDDNVLAIRYCKILIKFNQLYAIELPQPSKYYFNQIDNTDSIMEETRIIIINNFPDYSDESFVFLMELINKSSSDMVKKFKSTIFQTIVKCFHKLTMPEQLIFSQNILTYNSSKVYILESMCDVSDNVFIDCMFNSYPVHEWFRDYFSELHGLSSYLGKKILERDPKLKYEVFYCALDLGKLQTLVDIFPHVTSTDIIQFFETFMRIFSFYIIKKKKLIKN